MTNIHHVLICSVWKMFVSQTEQIKKSHRNLTRRAEFLRKCRNQSPQVKKGIDIAKWNAHNILSFVQIATHLIMILRKEYFRLYFENQQLKRKLKSYEINSNPDTETKRKNLIGFSSRSN